MAKNSIIAYFNKMYNNKFISIERSYLLPTNQYCINVKFSDGIFYFIIDNDSISMPFETMFDALESLV